MIILGIDPGIATTGFGLIKYQDGEASLLDYGCILTSKEFSHQQRIKQTVDDLSQLIAELRPDQVAIEELFFSKNVKTGLKVAESRGAIIYELSRQGLIINEYKPNQIKLNICGYGAAPKSQVQRMVQIILNLKSLPKPDDAADALAIAICHGNHLKNQHLYQNHA